MSILSLVVKGKFGKTSQNIMKMIVDYFSSDWDQTLAIDKSEIGESFKDFWTDLTHS